MRRCHTWFNIGTVAFVFASSIAVDYYQMDRGAQGTRYSPSSHNAAVHPTINEPDAFLYRKSRSLEQRETPQKSYQCFDDPASGNYL